MAEGTGRQAVLARRFHGQAAMCDQLGSPLYRHIATRAAEDIAAGGPVWRALTPIADLPGGALASLRLLGATHRLALEGAAPGLGAHYPSCGGDGDAEAAWTAFHTLLESCAGTTRFDELLGRGVQTNEVGRAAGLLGGFLEVARHTRLPLRLLEIGTSAGLNLRWDHFSYRGPDGRWGPEDSPVDQDDPWAPGMGPPLDPPAEALQIAERRGCDLAPADPTSTEGRLTLLSYVWPDMDRRFRLLDGACQVAAAVPATVEAASADEWLPARLAEEPAGVATVVFHSVFLQYLTPAARQTVLGAIAEAGARATTDRPLAWLRLEPPGDLGSPEFDVTLTTWPGGQDRRVAVAHPHGAWVRWLS